MRSPTSALLVAAVLATSPTAPASAAKLKQATLDAWDRYIELTEARIERELASEDGDYLIQDFLPAARREAAQAEVAGGEIWMSKLQTKADGDKIDVPSGLIHHWAGSVRVPGARLEPFLAWLTDYDRHKDYFTEVEDSRLLSRDGDVIEAFLRLKRKKVITVHYNTEWLATYSRHGEGRVSNTAYATKIAEIADPGEADEKEKPADKNSGFLWRLNTYCRFAEDREGLVVSCESLGLSRGIPFIVRPLVSGMVESVPRESLAAWLGGVRDHYLAAAARALAPASAAAAE